MSSYEDIDTSISSGHVRDAARASMDLAQARRDRRDAYQFSRREAMVNHVAVFSVAAALILTQGETALRFVGDAGSKVGDGLAKIGNILPNANDAAHDAAASHAPVPSSQAELEAQAQLTIDHNQRSHDIAAQQQAQQP
jgi:hypothetical protein